MSRTPRTSTTLLQHITYPLSDECTRLIDEKTVEARAVGICIVQLLLGNTVCQNCVTSRRSAKTLYLHIKTAYTLAQNT